MKNCKRFLLLTLLCCSVSTTWSQSEKDYTEAKHLIEIWLEAQKDFDRLPGLTALVVHDQAIIWSGAFGMANPEQQRPTQTESLYSICSISKLFTAVGIMQLYDEGKLRLDDRVQDLLPWYNLQQQYPESGPITVRSLLTHSAGLPRESAHPYWSGPNFPFPSSAEVKKELGTQETLYPASTYFQYSNLGMTLLGEIISQVSGVPYEQYIQDHILNPLGLQNTRPYLPKDLHGKELTLGYSAPTRSGERKRMPFFQANGIAPAAGFSSNVEDLGKFAAWQLRLLDTTATEVLRPATLKNMHRVHWTNPDWELTWGLGFTVFKGWGGNTVVGHGGSCPGYQSTLRIDPKNKEAYVVMINAGGTSPNKYANGIRAILKKVKSGPAADSSKSKVNLEDYQGFYNLQPWWSELYISSWEGQLVTLGLPSNNPTDDMTFYKHIEGDTFRRVRKDDTLGETLIFKRDANGKVIRAERHSNNYLVRIEGR
ncbi:MAG: serine hydrolase [Bacteroidota bacterium]